MNGTHVFFNLRNLLTLCCVFPVITFMGHLANPHTLYAGEIYRWIDEKGDVHYSDTAPVDSSSKGKKTKIIHIDDSPSVEKEINVSPQKQNKSDQVGTASSKEVFIYTLDT